MTLTLGGTRKTRVSWTHCLPTTRRRYALTKNDGGPAVSLDRRNLLVGAGAALLGPMRPARRAGRIGPNSAAPAPTSRFLRSRLTAGPPSFFVKAYRRRVVGKQCVQETRVFRVPPSVKVIYECSLQRICA